MDEQQSLLAALHERVRLHSYDPSWPAVFLLEQDRLLSLFPNRFLGIEHIGSTAVPGLSAKPVVDILAGVASMAVAQALAEPLCRSGYTTSAEFNATLSDRQWFMRWAHGHRTHHLHLVVYGAARWSEHLRFRDALRTQPGLAQRYAALKSELAALHADDREAYTQAKEAFIRAALRDGWALSGEKPSLPNVP